MTFTPVRLVVAVVALLVAVGVLPSDPRLVAVLVLALTFELRIPLS